MGRFKRDPKHDRDRQALLEERSDSQNRFDEAWEKGKKRMSLEQRLKALGITEMQAEDLLNMFGPKGSTYLQMKFAEGFGRSGTVDPRGWTQVNRPANGPAVRLVDLRVFLDHFLKRRRVISTRRYCDAGVWQKQPDGARTLVRTNTSNQLILDLDVHSAAAAATRRNRYERVLRLSSTNPVVFCTSMTGGLQIVWWLDRWWGLQDLQEYAARRLRLVGLKPRKGDIEIFPNPTGHIRVPLGGHGAMLDTDSLAPMDLPFPKLLETIKDSIKIQTQHQYPLGHPQHKPQRGPIIDTGNVSTSGDSNCPTQRAGAGHDPELDRVAYEQGLSTDLPRFEALPMIIRYGYFERGISDADELSEYVMDWLEHNHNNQSSRYLSNPVGVMTDIERLVSKHMEYVKKTGAHGQPRYDQNRLLYLPDFREVTKLAEAVHPLLGPDMPLSKMQHGLCELLLYAKRKSGGTLASPVLPLSTATIIKWFKHWCTNPGLPAYYRQWLDALEEVGLLSLEDGNFSSGRCRRYRLHHVFVEEGNPIEDFEMGLALAEGTPDDQTAPRYARPTMSPRLAAHDEDPDE